jgi:hypothetical protein
MKRAPVTRSRPTFGLALAGLVSCGLCLLTAARPASATAPQAFVVLLEHGVGTPSRAQPYLDELLAVVAQQNHWPKATGRYFSERSLALAFIRDEKPAFGILSLNAFLALKGSLSLRVIGEVVAPKAGGGQYFLVSTRAGAAGACKGQRLTTTFGSDPKFVDQVVARGSFRLSEFELVEARRPLEPLKQVLRGEAACALIDDAQLDALHHIERGAELQPVWRSAELPGMAVVAFPRADAAAVQSFKPSLGALCAKAKQACSSVGIEEIRPSDEARYRAVLDAYSKPAS